MPAASSNKRVKNTRISRPFIIGTKAWNLTPENHTGPVPDNHTKGWTIYVKGLETGPDIGTWLKKVQFKLHHTYADASRTVETQPFQVSETGYGEFDIELRLYFDSASGEKAQYRFHRLRLEPFGEHAAKMERENLVVAEVCEIVEFNEPSRDFYNKMIGDEQFVLPPPAAKGSGGNSSAASTPTAGAAAVAVGAADKKKKLGSISARGAGGAAAVKGRGGKNAGPDTASLPARSTEETPWSKEMEAKLLEMLTDAKRELDISIGQERVKAQKRQKTMAELAA